MNKPRRRPITKAEITAYGQLLLNSKPRPRPGDTCTLPDGRVVGLLDVINSELARVRFPSGHEATIHMDLLK